MTEPPTGIAIHAGKMFTANDRTLVDDAVFIVHGPRIEAVGPSTNVPIGPDYTVIDLRPCTLLPGLIDAHVHLLGQHP